MSSTNPQTADKLHAQALQLHKQNQLVEAEKKYIQALQANQKHLPSLTNLAAIKMTFGDFSSALDLYGLVLEQNPQDHRVHYNLACVYLELQDFKKSEESFLQCLEITPTYDEAWHNLGNLYYQIGELDLAQKAYTQAININPQKTDTFLHLTLCQKYSDESHADIQNMTKILKDSGVSDEQKMYVHFALGKAFDDCQNYPQAFQNYQQGNNIRNRSSRYNKENHDHYFEHLKTFFTKDFFDDKKELANASQTPVFIIGMPRSGTTLVEQIISNHSQVYGADELMDTLKIINNLGGHAHYTERLQALTAKELDTIAQNYLNVLQSRAKAPYARISNKLPANYQHLGLIATLFSNAHIIHCTRDPLDTCLSCYFHHFRGGNDYSYDLYNLGVYYRQYQDLMTHWYGVLPLKIHGVAYEDLVNAPEDEAKKLIRYLELDWEETCLDFANNPRNVGTVSGWQVRQGLYKTSLKRSQNYSKYLDDLKTGLEISKS